MAIAFRKESSNVKPEHKRLIETPELLAKIAATLGEKAQADAVASDALANSAELGRRIAVQFVRLSERVVEI